MIKEVWYILFDGESVDGYGYPKYSGRTLSKEEALKFFDKCKKNPYSIGNVAVVTDDKFKTVFNREELL